ncbi:MAG: hypothetical protein H7259_05750 [Cytophagales bacterium]|nr:hypothetical protein [Cytophaga sp.]
MDYDCRAFGQLTFNKKYKEWFGRVDNIYPANKVELSIEADSETQSIDAKIELVRQLAVYYNDIISALYDLIFSKFKNTQWEKSLSEIQQMCFLVGVSLKPDNRT